MRSIASGPCRVATALCDQNSRIELSGEKFDDRHGMEIGPHGGANGQLYYAAHTSPDREEGTF